MRLIIKECIVIGITIIFILPLTMRFGILAPFGEILDPASGIWTVADDAQPLDHLEIKDPSLKAPVKVIFDSYGIPHIYAKNEEDAGFALGYLHARDRLFQMELLRRAASGRLSELFGPDMVDADSFFRQLGFKHVIEEMSERVSSNDPEIKLLDAEARGINRFITDVGKMHLPFEFKLFGHQPELWSREDSLNYQKMLAYDLTWDLADLDRTLLVEKLGAEIVDELFPTYYPLQIPIIPELGNQSSGNRSQSEPYAIDPPQGESGTRGSVADPNNDIHDHSYDQETYASIRTLRDRLQSIMNDIYLKIPGLDPSGMRGSNNWAVDGIKSTTGMPILANDPHLGLSMPALWYEVHLVIKDTGLNLYGITLPGLPAVIIGFNNHIAWGLTNVGADVIDFYTERVNPANENQYWFNGTWRDMTVRHEVIKIAGGDEKHLTVRATHHGPIMTLKDREVAVQWMGLKPTTEIKAMYLLSHATNYTTFNEAIAYFQCPAQNIIYADTEGHIAIRSTGKFPIRSCITGTRVLNGSSGADEWIGWVPFEALPHAYDPPQNYLTSTNQVPFQPDYPYYLGWIWANGYRSRSIDNSLVTKAMVSVDDMKAYQLDTHSTRAESLVPLLLDVLTRYEDGDFNERPALTEARGASGVPDSLITSAKAYLKDWNRNMDMDLVAPTIFSYWFDSYEKCVWGDEYDAAGAEHYFPQDVILENLTLNDPSSPWFNDVRTTSNETRDETILVGFFMALSDLTTELGASIDGWTWGTVHTVTVEHLTGVVALGRGPYPISGNWDTLNAIRSHGGPSWRMVIDLSDLNNSYGVYPGGQCGNPLSPNYDSQVDLYRNGEYHLLIFASEVSKFPEDERKGEIVFEPGEKGWW